MWPLPEGLLVELVTPLKSGGTLDQGSLERLLARVAPWVSGVVAGTPGLGEALEFPRALRLELFGVVASVLPPDLPLFFAITGDTPEETLSLAQALEKELTRQSSRRQVYWVDLPLWWHSNRGLPQSYRNLCPDLSRPLILMNHPHLIRGKSKPLKHVNLRTAVLKKLVALPSLAGLIYRGEMRRFLHYYAATAGRPEFMMYEADERRFLTRPGARGLVSAGAQLFPDIWQKIVRVCLSPEETAPLGSQRNMVWKWSDLLQRLNEMYQLHPAPLLKLALHRQGILESPAIWSTTPSCPAHLEEGFLEFLDEVQDALISGKDWS